MADETTETVDESSSESSDTPLSDLFSPEAEASSDKEPAAKEEASQKIPESESSPDEKPDDKTPKADKKLDAKADKPSDKVGEKADAKDGEGETLTPEKKAEAEAKAKWENDENPYFKRYRDTASNWQKEHQEKLQYQQAVTQLQQETAMLRKIADGTYDPEVDDPSKHVSPETVATQALNVGKTLASRNAAVAQHGAEEVNNRLAEFNQLFGNHAVINQLVLDSESPVYEAFHFLDRHKFEGKYGSSPSEWHKNIRAEADKELRESIRKEVTDELMGRVDKKNNTPRGLSSSRGSNGLSASQNSKGKGPTPLSSLFPR